MGRGSSGMGGGSGSGSGIESITKNRVAKMTDAELDMLDDAFKNKIKSVKSDLLDIARENPPHNMPKVYYDVKKQQSVLESNHRIVIDEKVKRKKGKSKTDARNKTFVNSYGEATRRTITTSGYTSRQKKLSKELMRYIGG